uniref:Uncharacterized protein n=1 Tax=Eutreptiella gymnastica TaxID=73025 RepID=A0A7S4D442_9EUGL
MSPHGLTGVFGTDHPACVPHVCHATMHSSAWSGLMVVAAGHLQCITSNLLDQMHHQCYWLGPYSSSQDNWFALAVLFGLRLCPWSGDHHQGQPFLATLWHLAFGGVSTMSILVVASTLSNT